MNFVLIAAGIYLSAKVISFIAGESTETEVQKQKDIDAEIEAIQLRYHAPETMTEIEETAQNSDLLTEKKRKFALF